MNPFVEGGAALTFFFVSLGFLHGRRKVEPMIEWMLLFSSFILFSAYIVVFAGHLAVRVLNPLPVSMRERVNIVNSTLTVALNITQPPEQGTGYIPGAWYYLAAAVFFGVFPTMGYVGGYWAGARISGLEVHFYEYLEGDGKKYLRIDIAPPVVPRRRVVENNDGDIVVAEIREAR